MHSLFIPDAKWYNLHRSRDSKHSTASYRTVKEKISWKFFENYKLTNYSSKATMDGYFNLTSDFFLKCHSNVEKSEGQTIGQNIRKSDLFYMISTTWDEQEKLGLEGQVALFCSKTLRFLKIEA